MMRMRMDEEAASASTTYTHYHQSVSSIICQCPRYHRFTNTHTKCWSCKRKSWRLIWWWRENLYIAFSCDVNNEVEFLSLKEKK
ncbi:hypothetical protein BDA96_09G025100 [Sorghum bicolor]|uniref:Uncharacterized protein n=2 Tax=Sorghum bicolor TaxID=4558 RepID=A0A1Z5R0H9_SORBI|nr:hypothetical protein BDA96_09G025100 [Sorghum bicolor]OQU77282.1 hypothetical protein SORBI_3009G024133 [Sorghum bicolor]OQU77283.1 hypothetical protein SORBI_3009G024133 [Sorghum bicolor]